MFSLDNNLPFQAIIGAAGTGKTTLILNELNKDESFGVKTASTGIAAINLNGRTIHSMLGYYNTPDLLFKVVNGTVIDPLLEISKKYRHIIIDEISMISGQQLDLICRAIEDHNRFISNSYKMSGKHNLLGIIVSGDSGQLPTVSKPIVEGKYDEDYTLEEKELEDSLPRPFFKAKYWNKFVVHELHEIKRQNDVEFIRNLMLIREGEVEDTIDWFSKNVGFHSEVDENFIGTTIFSTNKEVDNFNLKKLNQISSQIIKFQSERKGKQLIDWKNIPDTLNIKIGCKVLLLCNDFQAGYANGDLAIVEDVISQGVLVKLVRTGNTVLINYKTLTNTINVKKNNSEGYFTKVIGSISYLPIRQGDSSTVHRSQGLTLDYVQIDIRHRFFSTLSGGLYTALSRCTTSTGLRLVGTKNQFIRACYINSDCLEFINSLQNRRINIAA